MVLWTVSATSAVVILLLVIGAYRRQIKKICRLLAFWKDHKTNLRMTASLPFSELDHLSDSINEIIDLSHEIESSARKKETNLKEAVTNLSHDIRTPLTSMDGYFQLLLQSQSERERLHYIEVIQNRISVLEEMLEKLFTYTKLENEAYTLELEPLDFGKCVRDVMFSFYDEFQGKGIVPEISFPEEPMMILGNEEALHRTIQNVMKNAAEHGGACLSFGLARRQEEAVFRCANDVKNPDEMDTSKVFTQFYKADAARTYNSTGLGLFIAKGFVERMNGSIAVSLHGNLFTVEIRFPIFPYAAVSAAEGEM